MPIALLLVLGGACRNTDPATPDDSVTDSVPSGPTTYEDCFGGFGDPDKPFPDYSTADATLGTHCMGTNQQDIAGIEKVVFIGDSVTAGTPPTPEEGYYRSLVTVGLQERFGKDIEIADCSDWGARTDDLLEKPHEQLITCFPGDVEPKKSLVIMTIGGNDMAALGTDQSKGKNEDKLIADLENFVGLFDDSMRWLKDTTRFPNGIDVVFANVYEYTDATGDLGSCPAAKIMGVSGDWSAGGQDAYNYVNQRYMEIAAETGSDMVFSYEQFCGHGFHSLDPKSPCYRGADTEMWFDATCIHPNETGHQQLADMFLAVVDE